jgi:four helix bundle protein
VFGGLSYLQRFRLQRADFSAGPEEKTQHLRHQEVVVNRSAFGVQQGAFTKDPVLTSALRKTLISNYSDFGEGFERDGNREFAQFVSIAKGSIGETRAQLIYALDFGYLTPEAFNDLDKLGKTAAMCLGGLIRYLNDSSFRGRKFKQRNNPPNEAKPSKPPFPRQSTPPNAER